MTEWYDTIVSDVKTALETVFLKKTDVASEIENIVDELIDEAES